MGKVDADNIVDLVGSFEDQLTMSDYVEPTPDPLEGAAALASFDFESDPESAGWTFVDSDADGYTWAWNQNVSGWFSGSPDFNSWAKEGTGCIASASFINTVGVLNPDNWAVSPAIDLSEAEAGVVLSVFAKGLQAEYAVKGQDPSALNDYTYRMGNALVLNLNYSQRGFSAGVQAKRVDNMGFKSVRTQGGEMLYINYLPAITKNHSYAFLTMYPYATQVMGEQGLQGDVMYKIKKGTALGGKYGTDVHLNGSFVAGLDTTVIGGAGTEGYTVASGLGETYYADLSLEVAKKLSKNVKLTATYAYQLFNPVVEGHERDLYHNHVAIADVAWKVNKKHSLRFEAEWMGSDSRYAPAEGHTDRRAGDWVMGLVEWNIGSHWFVSASDQYAYNDGIGNYYNISVGYTPGATRLQVGYGKQREGLLCIGGVCRMVPASNGLTVSLTTSF